MMAGQFVGPCRLAARHGTTRSNPISSSAESATNRPGCERHQVRIRVHAAGVNFADSLMVGGTYQVKPPFPFTPGLEAAGEVTEVGAGVRLLRPGQRVLAVLRNGGGYAEEIVLDAATVAPIPDAMDF